MCPRPRPPRQRPAARPHPRHRLAVADVAAGPRAPEPRARGRRASTSRASATSDEHRRGRRSRRSPTPPRSSSTGSGWAARTWRATRSAARSRWRWRGRERRGRPALSPPRASSNDREGRYARAVLDGVAPHGQADSRRAPSCCAGGPVRRTLAFGHLAARPWRIPPPQAAGAMRNLAHSPGFETTLRGDRGLPLDRAASRAARSPSPGERRTGILIYSRQAPAGAAAPAERPPRHAHRLRPRPDLGRPAAGRAGAAGRLERVRPKVGPTICQRPVAIGPRPWTVSIVIADADPLARRLIRGRRWRHAGMTVVAGARSGAERRRARRCFMRAVRRGPRRPEADIGAV